MTRSPMWNRGATASSMLLLARPDDLDHAAELVHADHTALEERLGDRVDPALVIGHPIVGLGAEALDIAPQLVHGDQAAFLAREQHHQRIDALLPKRVVMLGRLDGSGGHASHVVVAAWGRGGHRLKMAEAGGPIARRRGCASTAAIPSTQTVGERSLRDARTSPSIPNIRPSPRHGARNIPSDRDPPPRPPSGS